MQKLKAYLKGMQEFRLSMTTAYPDERAGYYDRGRDMAHRLTLRRYDC